MLKFWRSTTNTFVITWSAPATGYVLQSSSSLANPHWDDVTEPAQRVGDFWQLILPIQGPARVFRLIYR